MEARLQPLNSWVTIADKNQPNGFKKIVLFEMASADKDLDTDEWTTVTLMCTESAMEYVFNVEELGYFKYKLHNVIKLKSRYSYFLFLYLVQNQFRQAWDISLEELKDILNANSPTYSEFYRFNSLILSKAYKEINSKTDLKFEYQKINSGRQVVGVHFWVTKGLAYPTEEETPELPENTSSDDNAYGFNEDDDFRLDSDITGIN